MLRNYRETRLMRKFVHMIMQRGKKSLAIHILRGCFAELKRRKKNPHIVFKKAVHNIYPVVYFKLKKKGSRLFKLPTFIKKRKASFLCLKWIIDGATNRSSHSTYNSFSKKLAAELLDCSNGFGYSIRKKNELYNIILDNRPFLTYKD